MGVVITECLRSCSGEAFGGGGAIGSFAASASSHGLKNTQVAKDSGWINVELASKFAGSPTFRVLGEFTFDLFNSF
jgi:hypothetical protein